MQMSRGRTVLVFQRDGRIEKENPVEGLYIYDTRVLSRYEWRMNGKRPQFSCGSNVRQSDWLAYFIQAPENWSETPEKDSDPLQETLELRLTRSVGEGLHEDVQITNHTQVATFVKLELDFEVDFISRDEAEGKRKQRGDMDVNWSQPAAAVWELMNDYRVRHKYSHQNNKGTAEMHRGLKLRIQNASSP
ncbi:MAG TPA: glycogen debranching N-terminal domain-containing protein, partial [Candidatus Acidoferrum sp.]|nr:glycogen debranching N-terminal domain-containing protein [Candidatus Acidoferrum sp.]